MYFLPILISILVSKMMCSYTSYSTVSQCTSALSSASYKWCRYYQYYTIGYSCTSSDTSTYCGGSSDTRCSTDTTYLPTNSKKLLCPTDNSNCNTQTLTLATNTSYTTASSNYFSTSTFCWYRFYPSVSSIKSIKVTMTYLSNANAEVYTETSTNSFSYQGSVSYGNSLNVTVDTYDSVWVLVTPSSSNAYVYITAYASAYSSSSSLISLSDGVIAAIVICGFCFIFCIISIMLCIVCVKYISKANLNRNNQAAYVAHPPSQPPAQPQNNMYHQYQVPQANNYQPAYSNYDPNPYPYTTPAYPTVNAMGNNQIFTGQPIMMHQAPLAPTPLMVPSNPNYINKEIDVPPNKI